MSGKRRKAGFTLIEVLIVVVIMAVLAATIIPQFSSSTKDAKESTAKFNLSSLRTQIELYKLHHGGTAPAAATFAAQMTGSTSVTGATGTAGAAFPFGPYIQGSIPANPINGSNKVTAVTGTPAPSAAGTDSGWLYKASTGEIWIDDPVLFAL